MKYLDFLWALDVLYRYHPKYHGSDLIVLAEDIWKWVNNELPENSSTLTYLKSCFPSPQAAIKSIWNEISIMAGPYLHLS